ncbi:hypothetical protein [Tsukamurella sp. NPDC003166]|uniref:hypothetical protein n=1 Tax=Tsukamurella sp. NPDC003166 TaxID=3154444 RepID=UPI0033B5FD6A
MPNINTTDIDAYKRRLLTPTNLAELGITPDSVGSILNSDRLKLSFLKNGDVVTVRPTGLSINSVVFGDYSGPSAATLGYNAYMNIGAPIVEQSADIVQPAADVLSLRAYENRAGAGVARNFSDTVEFTISNKLTWNLEGTTEITFTDEETSEQSETEEREITVELEARAANAFTVHNHKDNIGTENETTLEAAVTDAVREMVGATSLGSSMMGMELMFGITGSIGGELLTTWRSSSTVSGDIPPSSRVQTMATQRRQLTQFTYELPITFGGFVALQYPQEVPLQQVPPQAKQPTTARVIAQDIATLGLIDPDLTYRPKGIAEIVSSLAVDHTVFAEEPMGNKNQSFSRTREHYV